MVAVVDVRSGGVEAGATGAPGKVGVPVGGDVEDVAVEAVPVAAAPVVGGIGECVQSIGGAVVEFVELLILGDGSGHL